ncbi:MAG: glycosyltransferase family 2 protein [Candidatus Marinimicrobia bacterium]|nr:glycosyltransferase family 2 protein [Candidatus Neomarinimicrobiota bacterium]
MDMKQKSKFSIIIPTYNRGMIALNTLQALEDQTSGEFIVIVIDQSSTVLSDLQKFKSINYEYKYVHIDVPSLPNARNIGIEHVSTPYAIFLDDDCVPDDGLVEAYTTIFQSLDPKIVLVAGRVIEEGSNIFRERADLVGGYVTKYGKTLKNFDTEQSGICEWAPGGNFCVRTEAYREVGGFDVNYIGTAVMEDADFGYAIRAGGYQVLYSPEPVMQHLRIPTGGLRQSNPARGMIYRAHNSVYFFRKHQRKRYLPLVKVYLLAVTLKEWLKGTHGISAFYYCSVGFIKGLRTHLWSG